MEKKKVNSLGLALSLLVFAIVLSVVSNGRISEACWVYMVIMVFYSIPALGQLMNDFDLGKVPIARFARLAAVTGLSIILYASWATAGLFVEWSSKFVRSPFIDLGLHLLTMLCFAIGILCSCALLIERDGSCFNEDLDKTLRKTLYLLPLTLPFVLAILGFLCLRQSRRISSAEV